MGQEPFKFTQQQKNTLLTAWKTKSGKEKANKYLNSVELSIDRYVDPFLRSGLLPSEFFDLLIDIDKKARALRGLLLSLPEREKFSLQASLDCTATEWGVVKHHDFSRSFVRQLEVVEAVCRHRINDKRLSTGPYKAEEYTLIVSLSIQYQKYFGKPPSPSANSNFRIFLKLLSEIIGTSLGEDLLKRALRDYF